MKNINIAILQPDVPHYRTEFFNLLGEKMNVSDVYVFNSLDSAKQAGFKIDKEGIKEIKSFKAKGMLLYNPFTFINSKYDIVVLMLHFAHLTTWLLLLTKWLHRKKIILWGQGISVKRYLKEEKKVDWRLKLMSSMADGLWVYMKKEEIQWRTIFPNKPLIALQNTLSGVNKMVNYRPVITKDELKKKYDICEDILLIFCARFESMYRRTDLLLETISKLDNKKYGFIIIGDGKYKPDFSSFPNVHNFGLVYDIVVKRELFYVADLYFQPGWVGLSIVEAMAYGKPICTFERTESTLQCVEYSYIESLGTSQDANGMIFKDMGQCIEFFTNISYEDIEFMGLNARSLVRNNLTIEKMVSNAVTVLEQLNLS